MISSDKFEITSPVFKNGGLIPKELLQKVSHNISPPLMNL